MNGGDSSLNMLQRIVFLLLTMPGAVGLQERLRRFERLG
jgi:hypothetical protein